MVHAFPRDISSKVNVIPRLEFDLAYYDVGVQHISNYTMGDSPFLKKSLFWFGLQNGISTLYGLFEAELWFIYNIW